MGSKVAAVYGTEIRSSRKNVISSITFLRRTASSTLLLAAFSMQNAKIDCFCVQHNSRLKGFFIRTTAVSRANTEVFAGSTVKCARAREYILLASHHKTYYFFEERWFEILGLLP